MEVEWDLAVTHNRNEELKQRNSVKQFFAKVSTIESLWDQETGDWLGSLPHHMRREAIPLFESSIDGVFEDYQLYPSYSLLTKGKIAKDPDLDFYHLSCVDNTEPQMPRLFMPLLVKARSLWSSMCCCGQNRGFSWLSKLYCPRFIGTREPAYLLCRAKLLIMSGDCQVTEISAEYCFS